MHKNQAQIKAMKMKSSQTTVKSGESEVKT